ncbi:hypothetical protein DD238_004502 [Peronospora effusa]|uniref:RxLR effector protein n=1 Tax=Peronospora effusa TaxID=542832 RepID=A0A3M6VSD9_9STRA|nr:hypothetical protein DD238_004502 [Peronospora effusa]
MHLHFTTLCVAMAACQVASSHAVPSRSNPEVLNTRHLRSKSDKLGLDEEERVHPFDLNVAYEDTANYVIRSIGESSGTTNEQPSGQDQIKSILKHYTRYPNTGSIPWQDLDKNLRLLLPAGAKKVFHMFGLNPLDLGVTESVYFTAWMHYVNILNEGRNSDDKINSGNVFKKILQKASK